LVRHFAGICLDMSGGVQTTIFYATKNVETWPDMPGVDIYLILNSFACPYRWWQMNLDLVAKVSGTLFVFVRSCPDSNIRGVPTCPDKSCLARSNHIWCRPTPVRTLIGHVTSCRDKHISIWWLVLICPDMWCIFVTSGHDKVWKTKPVQAKKGWSIFSMAVGSLRSKIWNGTEFGANQKQIESEDSPDN
jgi:hypothetical protein